MIYKFADTLPHLLLNPNKLRRRLFIQMQPINVDSNNTGKIFVGKGFQPIATVGHASQGEVLLAGAAIEEMKEFPEDLRPYKGQIWATSDTANQTIIMEEETVERLV